MTKYLTIRKSHIAGFLKRQVQNARDSVKQVSVKGVKRMTVLPIILAVSVASISGFAWNDKEVTIVADGQTKVVKTHLNSADGILHDAGIAPGKYDVILRSTNTVQNGTVLTLIRAFPVHVTVDGVERDVMTVQTTARGLADELGYKAPNYVTLGDGEGRLAPNSKIEIARVTGRSEKTFEQPIAVQVIREQDDTLPAGQEEVIQEGQAGIEQVQQEIYYQDGKAIKKDIIRTTTIKQMVPQIIKVGTRETVETSRGAMRYREVITMEASAYTPADGDGRGITATGMLARPGVVAVDPNVIPLGTRLYIPGYGMAIAADTGGAIRGNRIDLLMEDYSAAMNFGRQSVEVYVLE